MQYDVLIHNATIITVNPRFDVFDDGFICISRGNIEQVAAKSPGTPLPAAAQSFDAGGGLVLPGLVNTHTHLPMTLFRGLADDLPLDIWLNEHIFPAEGRFIDPGSVRLGTRLACAELLLSGTTTVCDGYFFENEVASIVKKAGLRAVLGQGVIDFPAPGVPDPVRNTAHAAEFVDEWQGVSPRIHPSIFCHSPYTCSDKTLVEAKKAAAQRGVLFQIHMAETENERNEMLSGRGVTPVQYLDGLNILDGETLAVHAVWVDAEDIAILTRCRTPLAHCPESNMKLAAGIAPVPACLKAGLTVGLGTDGCASNNNHDLFGEMDTAAKVHKAIEKDPTVMAAETVLKMATIDGAKAIGLDMRIGSLEPGKRADLVVLDMSRPHLHPMYHPVSHIVYTANGADVRDVMVDGQWVVREHRLQTLDPAEIIAEMKVTAGRIRRSV